MNAILKFRNYFDIKYARKITTKLKTKHGT